MAKQIREGGKSSAKRPSSGAKRIRGQRLSVFRKDLLRIPGDRLAPWREKGGGEEREEFFRPIVDRDAESTLHYEGETIFPPKVEERRGGGGA